MQYNTAIDALIAEYLASRISADEFRVTAWSIERSLRDGNEVPPSRVATWVRALRAVDEFVVSQDRVPRLNNRSDERASRPHEAHLADWLRHQRRRRDRLHAFQIQRLEIAAWFSWQPLEDLWDETFDEYQNFVDAQRRPPRRGAKGAPERSLAVWARNQRAAYGDAALPQHRLVRLESLTGWRWVL